MLAFLVPYQYVKWHVLIVRCLYSKCVRSPTVSMVRAKIGEYTSSVNQPRAAQAVDNGCQVLHNIVIGKPVQKIISWTGAP